VVVYALREHAILEILDNLVDAVNAIEDRTWITVHDRFEHALCFPLGGGWDH
jgi:hypothetical protein